MSENRSCEQPPDHHFVFRAGMPVSDIDRDNICPPPIQLTVDGPSRSTVRSGRRLSPSRVGVALDAVFGQAGGDRWFADSSLERRGFELPVPP